MVIFFDLDATLLDHDSAARAGASKFHETFRSSLSESLEPFLVRWETVSEKYFQANNPYSKLTTEERRRSRAREFFSQPLSDSEADARFRLYLETYEANWKLFPDSFPCLRAFQSFKLGLITNGEKEQHRSKIQKLGLGPYFSTVIISQEVGLAKPDKAIFELAAKKAGAGLGDCVYVGDRLQTDALAAQGAGMRGIWLDRKGQWKGEDAGVPVIRTLAELPKLLD
jgi:putative hydrolase of the HAD superfamily